MNNKKMEISEDLYEKIVGDLFELQAYRKFDTSCTIKESYEVLSQFEAAYDLALYVNTEEAYKRLAKGEQPGYSTGICEGITAGYGNLDESGYWEFPLVIDEETNDVMSWEDYVGESL